MVKKNHGFTVVELLAMIFITSIIIIPLMQSLIDNIRTNNILHIRRNSVSIADGTLYGFDKIDYAKLDALQVTSNTVDLDYYTEFNFDTCNQLGDITTDDYIICRALFGAVFNNTTFDSTHFRLFIYDYNLSAARQTILIGNSNIPIEVRDAIGALTPSNDPNPGLLRVSVWVQYNDNPVRTTVVNGLIIGNNLWEYD